jgi:hypothetical protein
MDESLTISSETIIAKILEIGESRKEWLLNKFAFEAKRTSRAKNYKVWREYNHAICLEESEWIIQRLNYIHQNPVRQMLQVMRPERSFQDENIIKYKFSSLTFLRFLDSFKLL